MNFFRLAYDCFDIEAKRIVARFYQWDVICGALLFMKKFLNFLIKCQIYRLNYSYFINFFEKILIKFQQSSDKNVKSNNFHKKFLKCIYFKEEFKRKFKI